MRPDFSSAEVIGSFGFDRVRYGSDWTVSELSHAYPAWAGILTRSPRVQAMKSCAISTTIRPSALTGWRPRRCPAAW